MTLKSVTRWRTGLFFAAAVCLVLGATAETASADRWDWSGSLTLDYKKLLKVDDPEAFGNPGAVVEWAQKVTVDASNEVTLNAKVCSSCHGLTIDQAYAEIRPHRLLNVEVGRINVPFGDFYLRHDPANGTFLSKPLPYAMGHMVRETQFNLSVIPMPYVDNGASFFGDVWIKDTNQIWYAVYFVNGFRSGSSAPKDFAFKEQTSTEGFNDNNNDLATGARMSFARGSFSLGGSYLRGAYDSASRFDFHAWGVDAAVTVMGVRLRSEYLQRRTDVAGANGGRMDMWKKGFYAQAELPLGARFMGVARLDGLLREGPAVGVLDESSGIVRATLGLNIMPTVDVGIRTAVEHWRFTDFTDVNVLRLGTVITY